MKKKILCFIATVCMVLCIMPNSVFAIDQPIKYSLYIAGVQINSQNKDDIVRAINNVYASDNTVVASGSATFDGVDTLSLNGFSITQNEFKWCDSLRTNGVIYSEINNIKINLSDNSTNSITYKSTSGGLSYNLSGIFSKNNMIITGSGTLNVTGNAGRYTCNAIESYDNLFFGSDENSFTGKVNAKINSSQTTAGNAISARHNITFNGGTVYAENNYRCGISSVYSNITINNGSIISKGKTGAFDKSPIVNGYPSYTVSTNFDGSDSSNTVVTSSNCGTFMYAEIVTSRIPEETPNAVYEQTGNGCGILSGVSSSMKYSIDGGTTWVDITNTTVIISSGVTSSNGIKVIKKGNGITTTDSEIQSITVKEYYSFISGENQIITTTDNGLTAVADVDLTKLTVVKVDGIVISADSYSAMTERTTITLKREFLNSLSAGKHTLEIDFNDGIALTNFTIDNSIINNNPDKTDNPNTNEHIPASLMLLSAVSITLIYSIKKKRK